MTTTTATMATNKPTKRKDLKISQDEMDQIFAEFREMKEAIASMVAEMHCQTNALILAISTASTLGRIETTSPNHTFVPHRQSISTTITRRRMQNNKPRPLILTGATTSISKPMNQCPTPSIRPPVRYKLQMPPVRSPATTPTLPTTSTSPVKSLPTTGAMDTTGGVSTTGYIPTMQNDLHTTSFMSSPSALTIPSAAPMPSAPTTITLPVTLAGLDTT